MVPISDLRTRALEQLVVDRVAAVFQVADPGNTVAVPVDLVTASASGLDPHISPVVAYYHLSRVAVERNIAKGELRALIDTQVEDRQFGVFGEPWINVMKLNLALDGYVPGMPSAADVSPATGDTTMFGGVRGTDIRQFVIFFAVLALLVSLVGSYMARIYLGKPTILSPLFQSLETWILKVSGVKAEEEMDWKSFAVALLIFNALGIAVVYFL